MKASFAILVGIAATAVQAYTPPTNQPDGAYAVRFDANGNPITKRYEMARTAKVRNVNVDIEARSFPGQQSACTGRSLDPFDYSVVQNCLGTFLNKNSGMDADKSVYYCRHGDTLLAICQYQPFIGEAQLYGSSAEIDNFNGIMDNQCGNFQSGWVFIKDWNKTYWRTTWGESVCDNAGGADVREQVFA